ncbi:calmodulin-dependent protein kinase [Chytriomyces cf. hyalinus JEL632]|nr:calmodulin-dependent protein kinase [Chytriomyces cf. hyalinus JEL632]
MSLAPCEYKTGKTLGQGSYATVKEAVKISTGEKFAVKVISKKLMAGREHLILNEIEILKKVSKGTHHIVTLHDYFETPNNLYLVMDLCTGGELFDRIVERGSFFEEDAAEIIRTVLDAVTYLHSQNIVHRDIKPENLLFRSKNSNDLVIADFGLSKISDGEALNNLRTLCGTPGYMAPEVLLKTGHGKSVDMWSIGVMTYFLLCGYTPFDAQGGRDDLDKILGGQYAFEPIEYWTDISLKAQDFIRRTILVDPKARMSAADALKHPWIQEYAPGPIDLPAGRVPTKDLLPDVKRRITGTKTKFRGAVDSLVAANRLGSGRSADGQAADAAAMDVDVRPKEEKDDLMVYTR